MRMVYDCTPLRACLGHENFMFPQKVKMRKYLLLFSSVFDIPGMCDFLC
jgi:hypothetical protein